MAPKMGRNGARNLGPKFLGPKFGTEIFGDRNSGPKLRVWKSVKSIGNIAISRPKLRTEISFPKSVEKQGKY